MLTTGNGTAQIVQAVAILLSASLAMLGYFLKSRLDLSREERQLRLSRVREKLSQFVAPAMFSTVALYTFIIDFLHHLYDMPEHDFPAVLGKVFDDCPAIRQGETPFQAWVKRKINSTNKLVGRAEMQAMALNPHGELAKRYRKFCIIMVKSYCRPLSDLVKAKAPDLAEYPSVEEFKRDFPCLADKTGLRHYLFIQLQNFTDEFEYIIDENWSNGDFSKLHPEIYQLPFQMGPFLSQMMDKLKASEEKWTHKAIQHNKSSEDSKRFRKLASVSKPQKGKIVPRKSLADSK